MKLSWQWVYAWSKKVHNWSMWGVLPLGLWMMVSGYLLHKSVEGEGVAGVNMLWVRRWHNEVSQWFLAVLAAQMVTGVAMWGVPKLLQVKSEKNKMKKEET